LSAALPAVTGDSPVFEATVTQVIDAATADQLGVERVTLLAVRPDGYVGLRADVDHVGALAAYERRVTGLTADWPASGGGASIHRASQRANHRARRSNGHHVQATR
jgi:hypothetical protein